MERFHRSARAGARAASFVFSPSVGSIALTFALLCSAGAANAAPLAAPPRAGTVAILELAAPAPRDFVLHGTVPVPPGTYPRHDGKMPFLVKDSDGARTGFGSKLSLWSTTLTLQLKIWRGLVGRLEYRHDQADERVFRNRYDKNHVLSPTSRSMDTISLSTYYLFF